LPSCADAARRCRARFRCEPAVELAGGLVIAGSVLAFGLTVQALAAAVFCAALVVVSATDLERRIVPNRVVLPAFVAVLVLRTIDTTSPEWLLGALGASGFLLLAAIVCPGGMGMGDVKLALLLGAMLGRTVTIALMLATSPHSSRASSCSSATASVPASLESLSHPSSPPALWSRSSPARRSSARTSGS
jgi:prepilin signal peptidase PulO-like enzyme (type II secretory pathway)